MTVPRSGTGPSVVYASLLGRCPRCGRGKLFCGFLNVAPACGACGLDYSRFEAGDGPAVFVILIVGAIVAGGALLTEVWFHPVVLLSLGMLRPLKAGLIVLQYKHRAEEGRLVK